MRIEPFNISDIVPFLKLAAAENWVAEQWEFGFLLSQFPQGCFAARGVSGETAGYVTSLKHECSGWIGNLIVAPGHRGQKIGERLFISALDALWADGVETVWLTASESGMPLYQKLGFKKIDTILRWSGRGRQRQVTPKTKTDCKNIGQLLNEIDSRAWGDKRTALLNATIKRGKLLQQGSGFAVVQPCGEMLQIGPLSAPDYCTADSLLKAALNTAQLGTRVCLDAPASNRAGLKLFNQKNMQISGSNQLMYAGVKPDYRPEYLYGLATMGSCG